MGADTTSFRKGMASVRSEIAATAGLGSSLQGLGTALTLGLTAPIAAIAGIGLKTFIDLDETLRNVNSIAGLTEEKFQDLTSRVMEFGLTTRDGSNAAAQSLYTIVSAGYGLNDINEAFRVMEVSVGAAEAGLADMEITTQAIVSGLLAYGETSDKATGYADALTRAVQVGVGTMEQFAGSVGLVLPTSAALNISWQELLATSAFLTQRGLSPSEAFVALNGAMRTLLKPGDALIEIFTQLGVASGTELIAKFGGFEGAIKAIGESVGNSPDQLAKLFTEIRAFRAASSIINNIETFSTTMDEFGQAVDGATDRARTEQMKSFAYQFDQMITTIRGLLESIGRILAPIFGDIINAIKGFVATLNAADPVVLENALKIGLLVAALGPFLWIVGALMSPLGLLIAGIALLKVAFDNNFLGIKNVVENVLLPTLQRHLPRVIAEISLLALYAEYHLGKFFNLVNANLGLPMQIFLSNVVVGNWEAARFGLELIWSGIAESFKTLLADPLGKALEGLRQERFSQIILGFASLAIVLGVLGAVLLVTSLPTIFTALAGALVAVQLAILPILAPLLAILIPLALGAVLIWAYTTNWRGFADTLNNSVRSVLDWLIARMETLNQLMYIFQQLTNGNAATVFSAVGNELFPSSNSTGGQNQFNSLTQPKPQYSTGQSAFDALTNPKRRPNIDTTSFNAAAGYGKGSSSQNNTVNVYTNDADKMLQALRSKGIDLKKPRKG